MRRTVEVHDGRRVVGGVSVTVALDNRLLARLRRRSGSPEDVALALASAGRVLAGPATDLDRFRVVRLPLTSGSDLQLLALTPAAPVEAAARSARRRVFAAGVATFAAIGLLAYALAPLLLRARLSQRQRARAPTSSRT